MSDVLAPVGNFRCDCPGGAPPKPRIGEQAIQHGRFQHWLCDDVDAAWMQLNSTLRPWGPAGPTPLERWQSRSPITPQQRQET